MHVGAVVVGGDLFSSCFYLFVCCGCRCCCVLLLMIVTISMLLLLQLLMLLLGFWLFADVVVYWYCHIVAVGLIVMNCFGLFAVAGVIMLLLTQQQQ